MSLQRRWSSRTRNPRRCNPGSKALTSTVRVPGTQVSPPLNGMRMPCPSNGAVSQKYSAKSKPSTIGSPIGRRLKSAVTTLLVLTVSNNGLAAPATSPDQPSKTHPGSGTGRIWTTEPVRYTARGASGDSTKLPPPVTRSDTVLLPELLASVLNKARKAGLVLVTTTVSNC